MTQTFQHRGQLATATAEWAKIPLTGLTPRRTLNLADKKADWKEALGMLRRFANSYEYKEPLDDSDAYIALTNYEKWKEMGEEACSLLIYGIDLGLSGDVLRPIYQEIAALYCDMGALHQQAITGMTQETGKDYGVAAPIETRTNEYRIAVTLLSLANLLDAQDDVPAIDEHVLAFDTDQLLDYLCVGGLQLQEFSEELFHKRPYGAMKPFFEQLEALPDPLVPYLQNQYTEFFKLSPKQQKKGGEWLGTGPWALEVGALSVLYGWDDTALRSCARYPADLVDYARSRIAQTADSGDA